MKIAIIAAVFLVAIALSVGAASAFGFGKGTGFLKGEYNEDIHQQLMASIEKGDYAEWEKIRQENNLPEGKIFQKINEDNFQLYQQALEAARSGDWEKASSLREELGLPWEVIKHRGMKHSGMKHNSMELDMSMKTFGKPMKQFVDTNGDGVCDMEEQKWGE